VTEKNEKFYRKQLKEAKRELKPVEVRAISWYLDTFYDTLAADKNIEITNSEILKNKSESFKAYAEKGQDNGGTYKFLNKLSNKVNEVPVLSTVEGILKKFTEFRRKQIIRYQTSSYRGYNEIQKSVIL